MLVLGGPKDGPKKKVFTTKWWDIAAGYLAPLDGSEARAALSIARLLAHETGDYTVVQRLKEIAEQGQP